MKCVYKFFWDCGRMGEVKGLFVADSEDIKQAIGKDVYFGEILGKHSEIYGTLNSEEITFVTDDETIVKLFEDYDICSGYNPLDYIDL